ncbi:jg22704 [Pararge aegeria aegeria]|uniref:Jg22704 protein n=1 Tax=Pararge aegeria aegeria TaxID=348720 RepID=A0A8S4RQ29_9NEOP|nr:jg22704 [Pararge aegeria aegeria]
MFFLASKAAGAAPRLASWSGVFARRARPPLPARKRRGAQVFHQEVSRRPPAPQGGLASAFPPVRRASHDPDDILVTIRPKLELMLKYFNENISLALQERYRDLHDYRKAEVEDSPREAKVPKIAEEGETVGGEGAFEPSAAPPFPRLLEPPKEEDSFVASWLHNSFKMTAAEGSEAAAGGSALDLRAAPLSLHIPAIQSEAQRFKMDFWNRSRPASPVQEPADHQQAGPAPPTPQPPVTPDHKIMAEKLVSEIQIYNDQDDDDDKDDDDNDKDNDKGDDNNDDMKLNNTSFPCSRHSIRPQESRRSATATPCCPSHCNRRDQGRASASERWKNAGRHFSE